MDEQIAKRFLVGDASLVNTSLRGYLNVPYSEIHRVFGEPGPGDGYKVAFEWKIVFSDGTVAAIYDYKSSSIYDDENPTPEQMKVNGFSDWHIGGITDRAARLVRLAVTTATDARGTV